MALPDEPEGWQTLQAMAQQECDSAKLAAIIDQMNSLLSQYECRAMDRKMDRRESLIEQRFERQSLGQEVESVGG